MQSKIHKYRYRYVDTYAHTWPHDDAEQHVASFPSRKDNEIVFAQEPWTDSLSATAAAPPKQEQLFREIDNYAKKKKGKKGKRGNAKNIRRKILGKCNWICCCLRTLERILQNSANCATDWNTCSTLLFFLFSLLLLLTTSWTLYEKCINFIRFDQIMPL